MKKISELFTDEERKQLSYLGSMLRREPTSEEAEQQRILEAIVDAKAKGTIRAARQVEKGRSRRARNIKPTQG
jgi:hypothetical protein